MGQIPRKAALARNPMKNTTATEASTKASFRFCFFCSGVVIDSAQSGDDLGR